MPIACSVVPVPWGRVYPTEEPEPRPAFLENDLNVTKYTTNYPTFIQVSYVTHVAVGQGKQDESRRDGIPIPGTSEAWG